MSHTIIIVIAVIVGLALIALLVKSYLEMTAKKRQNFNRLNEESVLLSIKVSKVNEQGPIAAEQMFASLHGMLKTLNFGEKLQGEYQEHLSFEITCHKRNIEFFVWVPRRLKEFVEGQIYAQYSDVEIREVEDYTKEATPDAAPPEPAPTPSAAPNNLPADTKALAVTENETAITKLNGDTGSGEKGHKFHAKVIAATELVLSKDTSLPIKMTSEFGDVDPLSGITATLGKLDSNQEDVWLQIMVRPLPDSWQESGVKYAESVRSGKVEKKTPTVIKIIKIIFFPITAILSIFKFLSPGGGSSGEKKPVEKKELTESEKKYVDGVLNKASKLGYEVKIRALFLTSENMAPQTAKTRLQSVVGSFKQFNTTMMNGFAAKPLNGAQALKAFQDRNFNSKGFILNIEELASVYHLPNASVMTPNIVWVTSKKTEPPVNLPTEENTPISELTLFGSTNFRGYKKDFGIKTKDRMRHMYIIGKTGMGKSVLLENIAIADVRAGRGITVVDPHGDLADHTLEAIPEWRKDDVVIFDPSDTAFPVSLNLLENDNPEMRPLIASGIVSIFYKLFAHSWGPRLEHVLRNVLLALLETPGTTLLGVMRMLVDESYRGKIVANVTDPVVRSFWVDEFANYKPQNLSEVVGPIQNKVGQFLSSHIIRNVLGQEKSTINIRKMMDENKIFIANLSRGKIGDDAMTLLGSMLITKIQLDAMGRANIPEAQRVNHHLIVDEFQNFATDSFATILSEARKYHLSLTMANQYVAQMSDEIKAAVFGNVGSLISFQTGFDDATYFSSQYAKTVTDVDIMGLDKYTIYVRLLIDNHPSNAFSAGTLPPPSVEYDPELVALIRQASRDKYGKPRAEVEKQINDWTNEGRSEPEDRGVHIDISELELGAELNAKISNNDKLGIFVDYFNLGGLIHVSEIPDMKIKEEAKKGDSITCWLIGTKGNKMSLTLNKSKAETLQKHNKPKAKSENKTQSESKATADDKDAGKSQTVKQDTSKTDTNSATKPTTKHSPRPGVRKLPIAPIPQKPKDQQPSQQNRSDQQSKQGNVLDLSKMR